MQGNFEIEAFSDALNESVKLTVFLEVNLSEVCILSDPTILVKNFSWTMYTDVWRRMFTAVL